MHGTEDPAILVAALQFRLIPVLVVLLLLVPAFLFHLLRRRADQRQQRPLLGHQRQHGERERGSPFEDDPVVCSESILPAVARVLHTLGLAVRIPSLDHRGRRRYRPLACGDCLGEATTRRHQRLQRLRLGRGDVLRHPPP